MLKWFKNYLHDRKQSDVINGSQSDIGYINPGVPQGSILCPLLFLIYINDLVININCMIKLFADDTSLYIVVDNPDTSAFLLNHDLDQFNKWSRQWLVSFNPAKTECPTISNNVKKPFHPSLIFDSIHLKEVESHKHLGVVFSSNLIWNLHIEEVVERPILALVYCEGLSIT